MHSQLEECISLHRRLDRGHVLKPHCASRRQGRQRPESRDPVHGRQRSRDELHVLAGREAHEHEVGGRQGHRVPLR